MKDEDFKAELLKLGPNGVRAYNILKRWHGGSVARLANAEWYDVVDTRGVGPAVVATWTYAFEQIDERPRWIQVLSDFGPVAQHLAKLRAK